MKPECFSCFRDAELRYHKLEIANEVLKALQTPSDDLLGELTRLHDKANRLESNHGYAGGELGALLINIISNEDSAFKEAYQTNCRINRLTVTAAMRK